MRLREGPAPSLLGRVRLIIQQDKQATVPTSGDKEPNIEIE